MSASPVIQGSCHCGAIRYDFHPSVPVADLPVRACGCSFCSRHGARYTADSGGRLVVTITAPGRLNRYRFGTETAEFLVCAACGVVPVVLGEIDGTTYAGINVNTAVDADFSAHPVRTMDYGGEAMEQRRARRKKSWIADVTVVNGPWS